MFAWVLLYCGSLAELRLQLTVVLQAAASVRQGSPKTQTTNNNTVLFSPQKPSVPPCWLSTKNPFSTPWRQNCPSQSECTERDVTSLASRIKMIFLRPYVYCALAWAKKNSCVCVCVCVSWTGSHPSWTYTYWHYKSQKLCKLTKENVTFGVLMFLAYLFLAAIIITHT